MEFSGPMGRALNINYYGNYSGGGLLSLDKTNFIFEKYNSMGNYRIFFSNDIKLKSHLHDYNLC